jgi:hypothetical protein
VSAPSLSYAQIFNEEVIWRIQVLVHDRYNLTDNAPAGPGDDKYISIVSQKAPRKLFLDLMIKDLVVDILKKGKITWAKASEFQLHRISFPADGGLKDFVGR